MSYVHGCEYTNVCASGEVTGALGDQKRTLDVLELELQTVVNLACKCYELNMDSLSAFNPLVRHLSIPIQVL